MPTITGTFTVTLAPQETPSGHADVHIARQAISKEFTGALAAKSLGQMLAVMGSVKGSAGYVAMERVTGTLDGVPGSFALMHLGTMNREVASLTVQVVPDSGTDGLTGIAGSMGISVDNGVHSYSFNYTLPTG